MIDISTSGRALIEHYFKHNYQSFFNMAKYRVLHQCEALAEDCVQDMFVKMLVFIDNGNELTQDPYPLMRKTLLHCVYDCNEKEYARGLTGRKKLRSSYDNVGFINDDINDLLYLEDQTDLFKEIAVNVAIASGNSPHIRRVLQLFYLGGYSHNDIGWLCDISEKTSRNIIFEFNKSISNE